MKKIAGTIGLIAFTFTSLGQIQGDGGVSERSLVSTIQYDHVDFPKPDIKKLRAEDALNDEKGSGPWRFGYNHQTELSLENSGTWMSLANGGKLWMLGINCPDAQTINLTFEKTTIPEGNELYVYDSNKAFILGKFTQKHIYDGQLGTELIPGGSVVVEYYVAPENIQENNQLTIGTVTHGYRIVDEFQQKVFGQAGSCNMNVNCPDGASFSDQKRSVVMIVSGSNGFCTGALINNTEYDGRPYVLTANHCYSPNVASWIFRFNWESPGCTNPGTEPSYTSLSGSVLRARRTASDFCLVEITGGLESGTVPAAYNSRFSGWDKSGEAPDWTFGIHHPRGDIKKISFDDDASFATQTTVGGVTSDINGVWRVVWDRNTTTEPVSSGSPLFDQNKRIIGQLWGGQAACTNPTGNDFYGRVAISWNPSGSDSTNQLQYWLDPSNTGAVVVDGYEPGVLVSNDGALLYPKDAKGTLCVDDVTPKITLANMGQTTLTSATISYGYDGVENQTYNWTGSLLFLQSTQITLPMAIVSGGGHTFSATITAVNGGTDEETENNAVSSSFFVMENPEIIELNVNLDCYARETSWDLVNSDDVVIYKSPAYVNTDEGIHNYEFCLSEDCYTFTIYDSYNDGMAGCGSGNGSFQIVNATSIVLGEMTTAEAAFGSSFEAEFCLGDASVELLSSQFDIYPNPSTGTVCWNTNVIESIVVFDLNGKQLLQTAIDFSKKQLSLETLSDGVYLVEFDLNNGSKLLKRIILTRD